MDINNSKKENIIKRIWQSYRSMSLPLKLLELIMPAAIVWFAFYVNRDIVIKGLYMDDLYMWSCYGEQNLWEFAFPIGTSTRFRPVYWLATYLQMVIIGNHIDKFVAFNIVANIFVAVELFYMARYLASGCRLSGMITAICYLSSRFAYYQIGQALGLMETMALAMSIAVMFLLIKALRDNACGSGYYAALGIYFLLVFVHERYISLLPLFYLVLFGIIIRNGINKEKPSRTAVKTAAEWISPLAVLFLIIAIRTYAIGKALPAGTGGTEVTDTFSIAQTIRFCFDQVLYILGVNAGPEYLCGLPWKETPWQIKRMTKFGILFIGLLCIIFAGLIIYEIIKSIKYKDRKPAGLLYDNITVSIMFCAFIALCIGCSSVTIRLEMRWIYVSYAAALLFASYMIGRIKDSVGSSWHKIVLYAAAVLFTAYAFTAVTANIFYRGYFDRIYFWADQERMNSLAEETVEKYGTDGVFGKNIYILENSYQMSDFYARTFFKTFDKDKTAEGTKVIFIDSITDVPADEVREGNALVLEEVPAENAYKDITEDIR
ncbi:MAG: hypothetical protein MR011_01140 [Lachnospiraceae bacterium]|nr:hypothetical protein [Lachnospiraceae bacterium]